MSGWKEKVVGRTSAMTSPQLRQAYAQWGIWKGGQPSSQLHLWASVPYNTVRNKFLTERAVMARSRITSKGQVTIPKEVRERLGLRPGDELEFTEENGVFHLRKHFDPEVFKRYRGYLKEWAGQDSDDLVREMRGQ